MAATYCCFFIQKEKLVDFLGVLVSLTTCRFSKPKSGLKGIQENVIPDQMQDNL